MPFVQGYEGFPLKKSEVDHDFWMVQSGSHMWLMESLALVQTGIQWFTFGCPQTVCPGGVLSKDSVYIYNYQYYTMVVIVEHQLFQGPLPFDPLFRP